VRREFDLSVLERFPDLLDWLFLGMNRNAAEAVTIADHEPTSTT